VETQSAAKGADVVALVNISTEKWPRRGIAPLWISERKPLTLRRISYIMLTKNLLHLVPSATTIAAKERPLANTSVLLWEPCVGH
jgi:hypothetical protein